MHLCRFYSGCCGAANLVQVLRLMGYPRPPDDLINLKPDSGQTSVRFHMIQELVEEQDTGQAAH